MKILTGDGHLVSLQGRLAKPNGGETKKKETDKSMVGTWSIFGYAFNYIK